jgi:hypothetical protein
MMAEPQTKVFHLGDVLSITTGMLVSPRYMDGVYDLVGYLTSNQPDLTELSASMAKCRDYLLRRHPALAALDTSNLQFENWRNWLHSQQLGIGEWIEVRRPEPGEIAL